jgi:molybdopterin synthase catalytic subunit
MSLGPRPSATRCIAESEPRLEDLIEELRGPAFGAVCTFLGTARDHSEGKSVRRLRYEAYVPMAEAVILEILEEAQRRFPGARVAARHRIGDCPLGEASVAVVAVAAHREEAFAACRYVIDETKARAPIWKQEFFADGSRWVGESEPQTGGPPS